MNLIDSLRPRLSHPNITRGQILFTSIATFIAFLVCSLPGFPFHLGFRVVVLVSSILHLIVFILFSYIFPLRSAIITMMVPVNIILMGFVLHFTGGIASPLTFIYFCIIISPVIQGIENRFTLPLAVASYLFVVIGEASGLLEPVTATAQDIYRNKPFTVALTTVVVGFMAIAGFLHTIITMGLRDSVEAENRDKRLLQKKLVELDAPSQIGLLVNRIIHDIKGPVGAISNFLDLCSRDESLHDVCRKDCEIMLAETKRVSRLVGRMSGYIRPTKREKDNICPIELLEDVLSIISFYSGAKKIEFIKHFPDVSDFRIRANKEELQQVYFNIFKNSVEALEGKAGRHLIEIYLRRSADRLEIEIRDNGKGIPPHIIHRIGKYPVSTKKEGSGIGLSIAKEILESYNGSLEFHDLKGSGACVVTCLPLREGGSTTYA